MSNRIRQAAPAAEKSWQAVQRFVSYFCVLLVTLSCIGCSSSITSSPPANTPAPKPQVVALTLEGRAERVNNGQILVTLRDTSGDGNKVVDVSTIELDKLTKKDGQPVPARLAGFNWSHQTAEKTPATSTPGAFELQLLLDTRFADPVGNLEGAFRTYAGSTTPMDFPLMDIQGGQIADDKLKALSINASISESYKAELLLIGKDVSQIDVVELANGSELIQQYIEGPPPLGKRPNVSARSWTWRSQSEISSDCTLRIWLRSDDRKGEPSWVSKPFQAPNNRIEHASLQMAGEITRKRVVSAQIKGPGQKLLDAKFIDAAGTPEQSKPNVTRGRDCAVYVSCYAPSPSTALQIHVVEDGFENMQVFRIENLAIEGNR